MLRPIGDELARVEQLRIAERAEFEAQLEALRKAPATSAPHTGPVSPAGLRDVTRLISALDTTLTGALVGADAAESEATEPPSHHEAPGQEALGSSSAKLEARLERTRDQLASARQRLQEQKVKTAARRTEAQELRGKVRELEKAQRTLQAERKKLLAPVRELVRRAKKPTKPLMRLVELLGIETE